MSEEHSKKIGVFDIESNGFVDTMTDIWCIWIIEPTTGDRIGFRPDEIDLAIRTLESYDVLIGHNIIDFDVNAILKLYPDFKCPALFDTLVLSRMLDPDRFSHALKSYGKQLANEKGDYGEQEEAWDKFSEEMYEYCLQDVALNVDVYNKLCTDAGIDPANPPAYKRYAR